MLSSLFEKSIARIYVTTFMRSLVDVVRLCLVLKCLYARYFLSLPATVALALFLFTLLSFPLLTLAHCVLRLAN